MAFQERMRSTQYQTSMADMRSAGLNPMLAYQQGGAGTPGGSTFSSPNIGQAAVTGATAGVNSAMALKQMEADLKVKRQTALTLASQEYKNNEETHLTRAAIRNAEQQRHILRGDASSAKQKEQFYNSKWGKIVRWWDLTTEGSRRGSVLPRARAR